MHKLEEKIRNKSNEIHQNATFGKVADDRSED